MNSIQFISRIFATTAPLLLMAGQPVCSQIPNNTISPPAYYGELSMAENLTASAVWHNYEFRHQVKSERELAFCIFEEQRELNENEAYCYDKMLNNLSYETGVNVLELL